jgi:hypothetical protein
MKMDDKSFERESQHMRDIAEALEASRSQLEETGGSVYILELCEQGAKYARQLHEVFTELIEAEQFAKSPTPLLDPPEKESPFRSIDNPFRSQ